MRKLDAFRPGSGIMNRPEPEIEQTMDNKELYKLSDMFLKDHKDNIHRIEKRVGHKMDSKGNMYVTHFQYQFETLKYEDKYKHTKPNVKITIAHESEDNMIMDDYDQLHYQANSFSFSHIIYDYSSVLCYFTFGARRSCRVESRYWLSWRFIHRARKRFERKND